MKPSMKKLGILLGAAVLAIGLAGCGFGGSNAHTSSSSDASSQSTSSDSQATSSDSASQSTSSASSSSQAAKQSSDKKTNKQSKKTTDLTQPQMQQWIFSKIGGKYQISDLIFSAHENSDGSTTIHVLENHKTKHMQSMGVDPDTTPTVGWYKVSATGELMKSSDGGNSYSLLSSTYPN